MILTFTPVITHCVNDGKKKGKVEGDIKNSGVQVRLDCNSSGRFELKKICVMVFTVAV